MYNTFTLPLLATLFLHGMLAAFIFFGAPDPQPLVKKVQPKHIDAKLITMEKPKAKPAPQAKPKPAPKSKPQPDQQKIKQQQLAKEKAAKEKRRQQEAKKRKEQEAQRKAEQAKKERLEKERLEQQRQQEQQQRMEELRQQEFAELLEEENAARQAASDQELATSYIALITKAIQNNWDRPPSARNNMQAELSIQLVPTGDVVGVSIVEGSGNAAFDRSAEKAVRRAERFPELQQLPPRVFEQYFRRLKIIFRPEDLRL